jgi:hypothetical protein
MWEEGGNVVGVEDKIIYPKNANIRRGERWCSKLSKYPG